MAAEWSDFREEMFRGSDHSFAIFITETNLDGQKVPQPVGGWQEILLIVKRKIKDTDAQAVMKLTRTGGQIVDVVAGQGHVQANVVPANTTSLERELTHELYAEVRGKDETGKVVPIMQGMLIVKPSLADTI